MTKKGDSFMKHSQIECCYRCEKRHERCHSTCEEYAKQKKDHEEYLDYIKKEKMYNYYMFDFRKRYFSRK